MQGYNKTDPYEILIVLTGRQWNYLSNEVMDELDKYPELKFTRMIGFRVPVSLARKIIRDIEDMEKIKKKILKENVDVSLKQDGLPII
jgi:ribosome maturation protein Sdo1